MDVVRVTAAGDGFHAAEVRELAELEERYRHELMDGDERLELLERVRRLRRNVAIET